MATTTLPYYSSSFVSPAIKCSASTNSPSLAWHHNNKTINLNSSSSSSSFKSNNQPLVNFFTRREAIGFGLLCLKLFDEPASAAAAELTTPCDFTLADSGLAFCDKLVGYGPQPQKGQLIKVSILFLNQNQLFLRACLELHIKTVSLLLHFKTTYYTLK